MKLAAIDVGGTFTDVVLSDSVTGDVWVYKHPTTPGRLWVGAIEGLRGSIEEAGWKPSDIELVVHGTTVSTNALIEHRGAKTGMITTEGFRDVIHVGRHQRPLTFSVRQDVPWQHRPLVLREYRKTVSERVVPPKGQVLIPLDEAQVRRAVTDLKEDGVEAIAVCFLFSFLNPAHEKRAEELIREIYPDIYVTTSSDVYPQFREFERFTTCAMNAFVGPVMSLYIGKLANALRELGVKGELHVMQSNGGLASPDVISRKPVTTLMSGPVGGITGGAWSVQHLEQTKLITLDVGGTSTDIGVITERGIAEAAARDAWIAGYPVMLPMLHIESIGAGGGSICHLDAGGALHVGPRSAGAVPGPCCYSQGGQEVTVTDAYVVMGYLRPEYFLGGRMSIQRSLAHKAVADLGAKLGMGAVPTAAGIIRIANENMANAIRGRTIKRGLDPKNFILVGFGGAGPLHAVEVAKLLSVPQVVIPSFPGVVSAQGLLAVDLRYDAIQVLLRPLDELTPNVINAYFEELSRPLREQLVKDGVKDAEINARKTADMRYFGQGFEVTIELPEESLGRDGISLVSDAFHKKHTADYGYDFPGVPIEMVSLKVAMMGAFPKLLRKPIADSGQPREPLLETGEVYFSVNGELRNERVHFYSRASLRPGQVLKGPVIVVQMDSTTLIPPYASASVDLYGNLIIDVEAK